MTKVQKKLISRDAKHASEWLMAYVLSLDQGTTSSRAILFVQQGKTVAAAQHEFKQIYPSSGWGELVPFEILTSQWGSAIEVLGKSRVHPRDVVALGSAYRRETTPVWDRESGKPLYNTIVWQSAIGMAQMK